MDGRLIFLMGILFSFFIVGCGDDPVEEETLQSDDLCIVTGIRFVDEQGAPIGSIGNPNERNDQVFFYPIPGNGNLFIQAQTNIEKVWLIPAEKSVEFQDVSFASMNISYTESELNDKQVSVTEVSAELVAFNFEDFAPGYYRIFVKLSNGTLQWKNTYLDSSQSGNEIYEFLLGEW